MNTRPLEEALVLCDEMLDQLMGEDTSNQVLIMLSNIKSKIIFGLDDPEEEIPSYEYKFKIGDRVRSTAEDNSYVPYGSTGTVQEEAINPWVKWDNNSNGDGVWTDNQDHMQLI